VRSGDASFVSSLPARFVAGSRGAHGRRRSRSTRVPEATDAAAVRSRLALHVVQSDGVLKLGSALPLPSVASPEISSLPSQRAF
jgi:hypothetical protein